VLSRSELLSGSGFGGWVRFVGPKFRVDGLGLRV